MTGGDTPILVLKKTLGHFLKILPLDWKLAREL